MSCWRVLELSDDAASAYAPQLLIKPRFAEKRYTVFLTDLSNIWGEELDLDGIIRRSVQVESPIEVSKQDTSQLAILLDTVQNSLSASDYVSCHLTRDGTDGLVLHTSIKLPEPLDSLTWKFVLKKRTPVVLKNELILPLLVSSHIQHERLNSLTSLIKEKDKAITRLVDQFESSNLDLATAFPSVGGSKPGRRLVKREQAAKQIPALRPFKEETWKTQTSEVEGRDISTLALFQEALSECTPQIPQHVLSEDDGNIWWSSVPTLLRKQEPVVKGNETKVQSRLRSSTPESSSDETEDEFETHEHFYEREASRKPAQEPNSPPRHERRAIASEDNTIDDNNPDAIPETQSHEQPQNSPASSSKASIIKQESASHRTSSSVADKPKGFRIGGFKPKKSVETMSPEPNENAPSVAARDDLESADHAPPGPTAVTPTKAKKSFRIGGKTTVVPQAGPSSENVSASARPRSSDSLSTQINGPGKGVAALPESSTQQKGAEAAQKVDGPAKEEHEEMTEETAEQKAERRRNELKRKNEEELAKKQAHKKKKRF